MKTGQQLLDFHPHFEGVSTPEPSLQELVEFYYTHWLRERALSREQVATFIPEYLRQIQNS